LFSIGKKGIHRKRPKNSFSWGERKGKKEGKGKKREIPLHYFLAGQGGEGKKGAKRARRIFGKGGKRGEKEDGPLQPFRLLADSGGEKGKKGKTKKGENARAKKWRGGGKKRKGFTPCPLPRPLKEKERGKKDEKKVRLNALRLEEGGEMQVRREY